MIFADPKISSIIGMKEVFRANSPRYVTQHTRPQNWGAEPSKVDVTMAVQNTHFFLSACGTRNLSPTDCANT